MDSGYGSVVAAPRAISAPSPSRGSGARRRIQRRIILAAAAATPLLPHPPAQAADRYWVGGPGSGNWVSTPSLWSASPPPSPGGASAPVGGDNVFISFNDLSIRTVNYNSSNTNALSGFTLSNSGGGNSILSQAGLHLNTASQIIGLSGRGTFNLIAGTNTATSLLVGSQGNYNQTGGNLISDFQSVSGFGTATFTQNGGTNTVHISLILGSGITGTNRTTGTYNLIFGHLSGNVTGGAITVGGAADGTFNQSGGTAAVHTLYVGSGSQAIGTYALSNGSLSTTKQSVGHLGAGNFTHSGGVNNVVDVVAVGDQLGSNGRYQLQAGSLLISGSPNSALIVGSFGTGVFDQTGGDLATTFVTVGGGLTGTGTPGDGTYNMSGGSALSTQIRVGLQGSGVFNQTGGTNSTNILRVGASRTLSGTNVIPSTGSYTIGPGANLLVRERLSVGEQGIGTFLQNGGNVTVNQLTSGNGLKVGDGANGVGTYELRNGVLEVTGPANVAITYVGFGGEGTFQQSGGTHTIGNELSIGTTVGSSGSYTLSGGTLSARKQSIGFRSTAQSVLSQSGGSNSAVFVTLGENSGGSGRYDLQGGTLNVSGEPTSSLTVGTFGAGVFNQSGGSVSATLITVANSTFGTNQSQGTYSLSSGSVLTDQLRIGQTGNGTFNQTGGTVSTDSFSLGNGTSGSGTNRTVGVGSYNIGGTGNLLVRGSMNIAGQGRGTFVQTGGSVTVNDPVLSSLGLAGSAGSTASYTLQNGTLAVLGPEGRVYVGFGGDATFLQSGGTHTVGRWLYVGFGADSTGAYTLNNGTLSSPGQSIGYHSTTEAVFTQNGGTNNASSFITIGDQPGGRGRYHLSFGTLNPFTMNVAWEGYGVYEQTFGNLTPGSLRLGFQPAGSGTVILGGGTLLVSSATPNPDANTYVGVSGDGNFIQNGGSHTIQGSSNGLFIGYLAGSTGAYTLNGGTLQVAGNEHVGSLGHGTFLQTGGTHTVTNRVFIAQGQGSTGSYTLTRGNLNALAVQIGAAGTFTHDEGTLTANVVNSGTFNRIGPGAFTGSFSQAPSGTLNVESPFTLPSGLVNAGTINIPLAGVLTVNSTGLDNDGGLITLAGGLLGGTGPLVNDGQIAGFGTIAPQGPFSNNAQLDQGAGTLVLNPAQGTTNNGSIQLAPSRQLRLDTPLTNNGTLRLNSAIVNGAGRILNTPAGMIAGAGTIHVPLTNQGTVLLDSATLNVVQPFTNTGVVELKDAAQVLGGAISNSGVIQGRGAIANAISNHSRLEAMGGVLALNGPVTNHATGLLRAGEGATLAVLNGLASNDGTIDLVGGIFDNNSRPLINNGTLSGRGTFVVSSVTNSGTIALTSGSADVFGPVVNTASGKVIITGGAAASFHGPLSGTAGTELRVSANSRGVFLAPVTGAITMTGLGDKYFEAGPSAVGPIAAGGATIVQPAATLTADRIVERSLTVKGDVNLRPGGGTSKVNELSIDPGASLDLADNPLIVDYTGDSSIESIRSFILSAYAGGSWTGEGLTSSDVTADPRLGIGYGESSTILGPGGGTFEGESVDGTAVLVRVTVKGDANLDNIVSFPDLVALAQNYGSPSATWAMGDFTYDGVVNFPDLVALAQNYALSFPLGAGGLPPIAGAAAGFNEDLSRALASVPEPSLMPVGLVGYSLCRRRRGRR